MSPGVYSALAEILYVKNVSKFMPDLHYYYMGLINSNYIANLLRLLYPYMPENDIQSTIST